MAGIRHEKPAADEDVHTKPGDSSLDEGSCSCIPGQPLIPLRPDTVVPFLHTELNTERIDKMYRVLYLLSKPDNISPLHHQALKGREILITERPDLHLVWYYDRIFIKPIPRCLLDHVFLKTYVFPHEYLRQAANGFLRAYAALIVHESDFDIARNKGLLPPTISWEQWCRFIQEFKYFRPHEVTKRYHYGELRLTRLNFYCKLLGYEWYYFETYTQYTAYFKRFIAPYAFVFGSLSLILSALQVVVTINPENENRASITGFSVFSICLTGVGLAFFPALYIFFQLKELLLYAVRHRVAG